MKSIINAITSPPKIIFTDAQSKKTIMVSHKRLESSLYQIQTKWETLSGLEKKADKLKMKTFGSTKEWHQINHQIKSLKQETSGSVPRAYTNKQVKLAKAGTISGLALVFIGIGITILGGTSSLLAIGPIILLLGVIIVAISFKYAKKMDKEQKKSDKENLKTALSLIPGENKKEVSLTGEENIVEENIVKIFKDIKGKKYQVKDILEKSSSGNIYSVEKVPPPVNPKNKKDQ